MDRGAWWAAVSLRSVVLCHFDCLFTRNSPEKAMAPHSSTLAWKILWTEKPGGLQSIGSQSQAQQKRLSKVKDIKSILNDFKKTIG